jgi:hypothetical protein
MSNVICETTGSTLNLKGVYLNVCKVNHTLWGFIQTQGGSPKSDGGYPDPIGGDPDVGTFNKGGFVLATWKIIYVEPMWVTRTSQGSPRPQSWSPRPQGGHPGLMGSS